MAYLGVFFIMNKKIRKTLIFILSFIMLLTSVTGIAYADFLDTVTTVAESYVIYDATTGEVILGKDYTGTYFPASITKIMTALITCENVSDLDQQLTFSQAAIDEMTEDSSTLNPIASAGEVMTIRDALYGMFYVSSNECAAQLAITVAGSREAFAQLMNERAERIGCTGTHFSNAHGLHANDHYTTPYDMALIMAEALHNEEFFKLATGKSYTIPATNMYPQPRECNLSHQIANGSIPYAEVFAGKTGRTPYALRTLVTAAQFNGHTIIVVIMKSSDDEFYNDTLKLLEYARGYVDGNYTAMEWTPCDEKIYVTGTNSLKVRDYPSTSGTKVIGSLTYGQEVRRTGTWGDWSQIEYLNRYYYVYSSYVTTTEPNSESMETVTTTAREIESVDFSVVVPSSETESDTQPTTTSDIKIETQATDASGNVVTESADNEKKGIISNMEEGPVKIVMIVCIVIMVVLFIAALIYNLTFTRRSRRRRDHRRTHHGDEFWK